MASVRHELDELVEPSVGGSEVHVPEALVAGDVVVDLDIGSPQLGDGGVQVLDQEADGALLDLVVLRAPRRRR